MSAEYGKGFSRPNLFHMIRFAEVFPEEQIVYALSRQLSWTHFRSLIYLEDPLQRDFYAEMCRVERWSTRMLRDKIQGMLFERTGISREPKDLARQEMAALREASVDGSIRPVVDTWNPASPGLPSRGESPVLAGGWGVEGG